MAESALQSYRPTAYLDQWVWIRLARAAVGKPDAPGDPELLQALVDAGNAGVAFPLSWTHYIETESIRNPRQRRDVADVMASISHFRTIRSRRDLLRNQLLVAMHEQFGRPTFRPQKVDPLGVGVHWAFQGVEKVLQVHGTNGGIIDLDQFPRELWIRTTQGFEYQVMAGPGDSEVGLLRERYGYKPEATAEVGHSRLEWEQEFVGLLVDTPPKDPAELRVWIQAREVTHENLELLVDVFKEYGLPIRRLTGGFGDDDPERRREFISEFFDRLPSVRVAIDLKLAIHRNNQRGWARNDVYDTDAMSIAIPYSAVVVADKAVADALRRVKAGDRNGTVITGKLEELAELLPEMVQHAQTLPDPSGWEAFAPGVGFSPLTPEEIVGQLRGQRLQRRSLGSDYLTEEQGGEVSGDSLKKGPHIEQCTRQALHMHDLTTSTFGAVGAIGPRFPRIPRHQQAFTRVAPMQLRKSRVGPPWGCLTGTFVFSGAWPGPGVRCAGLGGHARRGVTRRRRRSWWQR